MKSTVFRAVVSLALVTGALLAQPANCTDEKSHQFDFWIGEWEVFAGGALAGTNSIQPVLGGCVLQETWTGVKGSAGTSLNFYNPEKRKWQQFWVWKRGTTLELEGEFSGGKMILEGKSIGPSGKALHNRITWFKNDDGTVRQHWETSEDEGKTWSTSFDGLYRRK